MLKIDFSTITKKELQKRNGMSYFCMQVKGNFALICVTNTNTKINHYEVWKLRTYNENEQFRNKWNIKFPCNEDFGYYGWSFQGKINALNYFNTHTAG